jgi:hypothetical protein
MLHYTFFFRDFFYSWPMPAQAWHNPSADAAATIAAVHVVSCAPFPQSCVQNVSLSTYANVVEETSASCSRAAL